MSTASTRPRARSRSDSLQSAMAQVPLHEISASSPSKQAAASHSGVKPLAGSTKADRARKLKSDRWDLGDARVIPKSFGFWEDLRTGRWLIIPSSSGTLLLFTASLYLNWHLSATYLAPYLGISGLPTANPFAPLWTISYALPLQPGDIGVVKYGKGWLDIVFLLHQIITFSFLRQSITLYILRPWAMRLGIKKEAKVARFMEQSYSFLYYGSAGVLGTYIMYSYLPTWYFNTAEFWIAYPHWRMVGLLKYYYLLQFAYWLQQMIILIARVEKPRKDFKELVAHHIVTLWLIGWSYGINLTMIGNAVFVTMDFSDVFLALAKCVNYAEGPRSTGFWSTVCFGWFVVVWTYLRHWLNLRILWSVWFEFDLVPAYARFFDPPTGHWLAPWMKYQVFVPIALIQLLNLFWYVLILRILVRTVRGKVIEDDRSEDEAEPEEEAAAAVEGKKEQ